MEPADHGDGPIDASSTLLDEEDTGFVDDDDEDDDSKEHSLTQQPGFIMSKESLQNAKGASQSTSSNNPALQIQKYEEALRSEKRRFLNEKRSLEERHLAEVNQLQQQMKALNSQNEQKVKTLKEELQRMKEANSAGSLSALQKQLQDEQEKSRKWATDNDDLRDQLNEARLTLEQEMSTVSSLRAELQEMEAEMELLRKKREEERMSALASEDKGKTKDRLTSDGFGGDVLRKESVDKSPKPRIASKDYVEKFRKSPISPENVLLFRSVAVLILFTAVGFFLFKKILR